jgi:hypothetical protein
LALALAVREQEISDFPYALKVLIYLIPELIYRKYEYT